jgi:hypothetical protein
MQTLTETIMVGAPSNAESTPAGQLWTTGSISSFFSDVRLKDRLEYIRDASKIVNNLSGIYYKHSALARQLGYSGNQHYVGLIAQDVQKVLPEVVSIAPFDRTPTGNSLSGENYLTVQYDRIIPVLIEAIKDHERIIQRLREELDE